MKLFKRNNNCKTKNKNSHLHLNKFTLYYIRLKKCRNGGIGRRARLKIEFLQRSEGSSPSFGTNIIYRTTNNKTCQ